MLLEAGGWRNERGETVQANRARDIVLSRGLCRFKSFVRSPVVPKSKADQAAWLFAEANAPFADTAKLVIRTPYGASIWYWDNARVGPVRSALPETLLQSPGSGWRIVRCTEGYEAQYWSEGYLRGSTWRRTPFNPEQWAAFALSIDGAESAPDDPPEPASVRLRRRPAWRLAQIRPFNAWLTLERCGLAAGLAAAGVAAFFAGDFLHMSGRLRAEAGGIAALEREAAEDASARELRAWQATARAYADSQTAADTTAFLADALEVIEGAGLETDEWSADQTRVNLHLTARAGSLSLRDLVSALEAKPLLCNVTPSLSPVEEGIVIVAGRSSPADPAACTTANASGADR